MDDDNNKGTGILGLGGTPVSNRGDEPGSRHERVLDSDRVRDRDLAADSDIVRERDTVGDSDILRDRDLVTDEEVTRDRTRIRDNEEAAREGAAGSQEGSGILGLGGAPVPKSPLDPRASDDLDAVHRRRERMLEGEQTERQRPTERHSGATGIDMGSGGEGTDISGR